VVGAPALLVEQPAVISAMALIIKTSVGFVMRPFAVETVLCRVCLRAGRGNSSRLVREFFANKVIGAKQGRGESYRYAAAWKFYPEKPMDYRTA
jgi:hypothetical protein